MTEDSLHNIRAAMRSCELQPEQKVLRRLIDEARLTDEQRQQISMRAAQMVSAIRAAGNPGGLMGLFLSEYGLATAEGIALARLAEALLRTPDAATASALIEDKITASDWARHQDNSSSALINHTTWVLLLTSKCLRAMQDEFASVAKPLGEPTIRHAVTAAMKMLGRQFVLGQTIDSALGRSRKMESKGYTYSYDMLGEAVRTEADAKRYHRDYATAIKAISMRCKSDDFRVNPGISIKLSALHPRYEQAKNARVLTELAERIRSLAVAAKAARMGLNIDAEEAERLDLSLDLIEAVLSDEALAGWDGFGVVIQAYGKRASCVIDWLYALAQRLDRRIMIRLVKGAYWDLEIKRAQMLGLKNFPVFTRKCATDVSYIANARRLFGMTDRFYLQLAGHNAHTVAALLTMATKRDDFEFQRLQGMGENLHDLVLNAQNTRCRIYAPVGAHRDLLPYLMRRLLENGANSSFVNQIADCDITPDTAAADPFTKVISDQKRPHNRAIAMPSDLFGNERKNSIGWDLTSVVDLAELDERRSSYQKKVFDAHPLLVDSAAASDRLIEIRNPALPDDLVGKVGCAAPQDVAAAAANAQPWEADCDVRTEVLRRAADLYEKNTGIFLALATREAGKTLSDALGELREAVDFLRYYASQISALKNGPRGVIGCISPWNFPLAIFTGQVAGALAAGNAVLAKPAGLTPLCAFAAVQILHDAGVPITALQLLPGPGQTVGMELARHGRVNGICFTGSTATAQIINRTMAKHMAPEAVLVAETGGLNAMIVDSTALPEQVVADIVSSAFQSAGQRCSSLRCLYVQEDIAQQVSETLFGAMEQLQLGDPWELATDVGPVIDSKAKERILAYIDRAQSENRVLKSLPNFAPGWFVPPTVIQVDGIADLKEELFGPVLHMATFKANEIDRVVAAVNASGYGLTFGLHTRIDSCVQRVCEQIRVGNIYVNRNQIGAVVGSQPFGGEGLSGTGPKAGGPHYVRRLTRFERPVINANRVEAVKASVVAAALAQLAYPSAKVAEQNMAGPTGETNRLDVSGRGKVLCLGPSLMAAQAQAAQAHDAGCTALTVCAGGDVDGRLEARELETLEGFDAVIYWGPESGAKAYHQALATRDGVLLPLICESGDQTRLQIERHICIDTTASGGNATLLIEAGKT